MELKLWSSCLVLLLQAFVLPSCRGVSVRFSNQNTVYVVKGQNLFLEADIQLVAGDSITKVTWERQPEGEKDSGKSRTTVAEYPAKTPGQRATVEKNGCLLKLVNYQSADSGVYTITVTDQRGGQSSARRTVHEYEAVHHVSVMVNVSHDILHCTEAWGTEPVFRWLHEQEVVTEDVGRVSADGASLYLKSKLCGHFTCVVSNKLGHSSDTYTADPCKRQNNGTTVIVVCLVLLLLLAGGLAFLFWRRRSFSNRRQRFWNSHEDAV
ncbi:uncharacterized protein si:dkeyp-97a10.2 [Trichomycterus rosablanca]|uniref:uncharacterized protein si:dkeyp-97a10.2 n=1 Tax=Trichomycterus rosablanca TaxID=2290929 RepID=UPI002F35A9B7